MRPRLRPIASKIARRPAVGRVRRSAALFVAPFYHERISALHDRLNQHDGRIYTLEQHMPSVLNAIASVNGSARLLRREMEQRTSHISALVDDVVVSLDQHTSTFDHHIARLDGHVRDELWPLLADLSNVRDDRATLAWLVGRVESVRSELMFEMRYGSRSGVDEPFEPRVLDQAKVDEQLASGLRVNLGSGMLTLDGYINVDMRELPGVDIVARVDNLPFEPGSLKELSSAHTLEHFPQEQLTRQLLPYWYSLLAVGGVFRATVPDLGAMIEQLRVGEISFDAFRLVAYGGQEYEGDFHHTGFTTESLGELLTEAGFVDVEVVEQARPNGACLEFEIVARRPG